jgi:hypothetical protein
MKHDLDYPLVDMSFTLKAVRLVLSRLGGDSTCVVVLLIVA